MAPNYAPFWTSEPTLVHIKYLLTETLFGTWMFNTMLIALVSTIISLLCGLFAGYALSRLKFPFAGSLGTGIFITYLVPQTLLFIPLADVIRPKSDALIADTGFPQFFLLNTQKKSARTCNLWSPPRRKFFASVAFISHSAGLRASPTL